MEHIFRAYDIRGIYNKDLTVETMVKIGMGLGTAMKKHNEKDILVGNDIRTSSPLFSNALIAGLLTTGAKVSNAGMSSFGVTLFGGWKMNVDVSAYITASHLPPEWNGLKLYNGEGEGYSEEQIYEIKDMVMANQFQKDEWNGLKNFENVDYKQKYIDFMKDNFSLEKKLKVVIDCGNGSACLVAPEVLRALGIETIELYCDVDPLFPNRESEPTKENLHVLSKKVIENNADFGVAFDGDGDRGVIVDNKGRVLSADPVGIIIGKEIFSDRKGVTVANVESSMAVEKELEPIGTRVDRIPVGHTFLTREAKKRGALLGIERSGHMIMPEYFLFDDAMLIPLKMAEILAKSEKSLSNFVDDIPIFPKETFNFDCHDNIKFDVIKNLQKDFSEKYEKVNIMDGVRVDLDNGWGLIRASNTSPVIRVTVEADSNESLKDLSKLFNNALKEKIN